jgi:transposase
VGVDTHKHLHVAVALDRLGARLGELTISADSAGYAALAGWAERLGRPDVFGIEGTGSYGVGLASFLRRRGHSIIEVNRGDRRSRRANGKSDTLDAEAAARAVLAGEARAVPKSADGVCEMIRQVKIARDTAVKARTQALITLKCILVNAPAELREQFSHLTDKKLIDRCAALRPGTIDSTTASAKHTLRALARRWLNLAGEIGGHDRVLEQLTTAVAPSLREGFGIGHNSGQLVAALHQGPGAAGDGRTDGVYLRRDVVGKPDPITGGLEGLAVEVGLRAGEFRRLALRGDDERWQIFPESGAALHHHQSSDMHELVKRRSTTEKCTIVDAYVTGQQTIVGDDNMVSD